MVIDSLIAIGKACRGSVREAGRNIRFQAASGLNLRIRARCRIEERIWPVIGKPGIHDEASGVEILYDSDDIGHCCTDDKIDQILS